MRLYKYALLVVLTGCAGSEMVSHTGGPIAWDMSQEDELMAYTKIQIKTYETEGFTEVTPGETSSSVSSDKMRVWITKGEEFNYGILNGTYSFPVGTTIIRVLYDAEHNPKKITATIKATAGANPNASDWYFAVADENGVIQRNDQGGWSFGAMQECNICHQNRLQTDGLFGLSDSLR